MISSRSSLYASNAGSASLSGYLYVQTGIAGHVNEFSVASDGSLTRIGSVTVPGAAGGQGIVAS